MRTMRSVPAWRSLKSPGYPSGPLAKIKKKKKKGVTLLENAAMCEGEDGDAEYVLDFRDKGNGRINESNHHVQLDLS